MTETAKPEISIEEADDMLLGLYEDEAEHGDGSFFEHIGLPPDATWGQFRQHYDDRGGSTPERVGRDLETYPPPAVRRLTTATLSDAAKTARIRPPSPEITISTIFQKPEIHSRSRVPIAYVLGGFEGPASLVIRIDTQLRTCRAI